MLFGCSVGSLSKVLVIDVLLRLNKSTSILFEKKNEILKSQKQSHLAPPGEETLGSEAL